MKTLRALVPLLPALLTAGAPGADTIYRWVDANGKVTFSSTPPPPGKQGEVVTLPPPPSQESVEAQRERERAISELGGELQQQRLEREALQAEEQRARERAAAEPPPPSTLDEPADYYGSGWSRGWLPTPPRPRPPRPPWPERPVPPPNMDHRNPDHPAFWPREPLPVPLPRGR